MKRLLLTLIIWGLTVGIARGDLVAYWPMDEGSGTVTADVSGNGLDATGRFAESGDTPDDDNWVAPAEGFVNEAGDVHIIVSADGTRYRVLAGDDWREFSAVDADNVR